jgi:hypothetical protein
LRLVGITLNFEMELTTPVTRIGAIVLMNPVELSTWIAESRAAACSFCRQGTSSRGGRARSRRPTRERRTVGLPSLHST